ASADGAGLVQAVAEIVSTRFLSWPNYYDRATPAIGLLSDGLLHSAEVVLLAAGGCALADLLRRRALVPRAAWAGFLLGAGGFQLFDGVVDHKVLRVHQVRYGVDLLPYDVAWIAAGVLLLIAGAAVLARSGART